MLEIRSLSKRFGGLAAVDDVSTTIERGRINAIIGPNGAGKTTFFNLISGMTRPSGGSILLEGRDVTGLRADQVARLGIARTFQTTALFDKASVLDNLIVGHRLRTRSGLWDVLVQSARLKAEERACREKAREALDFVGLSHMAGAWRGPVSEERKRVAFALAIATEPKLGLLDELPGVNSEEPSLGTDPADGAVRMTVCLIEHKMNMIMSLATRHGATTASRARGTPGQVRADPQCRRLPWQRTCSRLKASPWTTAASGAGRRDLHADEGELVGC
jgi:branched-chain amino acid transport system ATP-binding protein